jgi:hypothetical protein
VGGFETSQKDNISPPQATTLQHPASSSAAQLPNTTRNQLLLLKLLLLLLLLLHLHLCLNEG